MTRHVISVQVKQRSGGRSQNYMPPEAAQAARARKTVVAE